jgi:hypothetical protein
MYQIRSGNLILATGSSKAECIEQLNLKIRIEKVEKTQTVKIENKFWIDREYTLPNQYTDEFNRHEILNDIAHKVCKLNGFVLEKIVVLEKWE